MKEPETQGGEMESIETYVPVGHVGSRLPEMLETIRGRGKAVAITRDGEPAAVLLSYDTFAGLLETMEILADNDTVRQLARSVEDLRRGRVVEVENIDEAFE